MTQRTATESIRDEASVVADKPKIGFVTKVYAHDGTQPGLSNHEVNVQLASGQEEFRKIPIHTDHNGSIYVPQVNDAVEVGFLDGKTERPYVSNVIHTTEDRAPLGRPGHFRRAFGPDTGSQLFLEAERADHAKGDPNLLRIAKKPDGLSEPSREIVLDDSGSETEIRINTKNGSVVINDDGSIVINGGTKGAITDIGTIKDGDGRVTDITIVRSDNIFVK